MGGMPRPSKPLIKHDAVIETSLRIIDTEGLDAFSLPRLARELNVRAPSLYHHFADKAEILREISRRIVLETRVPDDRDVPNWIEWFVALSLAFRETVLRHRNAAPVLLQFLPRTVLTRTYDATIEVLAELGVPPEQRILVVDGLDRLTLGASIIEAAKSPAESAAPFTQVDPEQGPSLVEAVALNPLSPEELFAESIRCFLRGAAPQVPPDAPAPGRVRRGPGEPLSPSRP
jgi:TetR/AcrR family transcriptional regulator, tetracycline repressor protein